MSRFKASLLFAFLCLASQVTAVAQVNTATVFGSVIDPSGAAVAQASVSVTNEQPGAAWNTSSNTGGQFTLAFLPVGRYSIAIRAAGLKESRSTGVQLTAGEERRMEFALTIGNLQESVRVTAEAPLINTSNAEQNLNVNELRIRELPSANRDWSVLLQLGAGITVSGNAVVMNGLPPDGFRFTVDGADASGNGESETLTSLGYIKAVSLEAIREVNVTSGIAPAETGPTMSGNVNVITRSGTNEVHGSLFLNNRLEDFSARNQFLATKPPLTFNQFGGSVGGPAIKNKLFYFGVYEGYRSRAFASVNGNVPTKEFRDMAVAALPAYKTFFDTFPLPTAAYPANAVTGFYQSAGSSKEDSDHFSGRGDYQISGGNLLAVRYTKDKPFQLTPRVSAANNRTYDVSTHKGVVSFIHSAASWSAETRYGYNRFERARLDHIYSLGISAITGSIGFSNSGELMENVGINWSGEEVFALYRGPHTISFGGRPYNLYNWINGYFIQDDIRVSKSLMVNLGLRYDHFSVPKESSGRLFNRTGPFGIGPITSPDSIYDANWMDFSPRLGLAWTVTPKTVIRAGAGKFTSAHNQFGGPVELIQNAVDEPNRVTFSAAEAARFNIRFPTTNAAVLPLVKGGGGPIAGTVISRQFPQPYSFQWNLSVSRELAHSISVESAYIGNHAVHANVVRKINKVDAATGLRRYPDYSEFNYYDGSESVRYNAWQNTGRRRFSKDFQMGAVYTFAKTISFSNAANLGYPNPPQDTDNIRGDKGPSPFDIRHHFHTDFLYELPFARLANSDRRASRLLLAGWQFSGIYTAETGAPLNVSQSTTHASSRPDYVAGNPYAPDPELTLRYLNRDAFARVPIGLGGAPRRPGNFGRNALRAPGFWNLDMSLSKNLQFSERYRLQIRCDMLNAFNHTSFSGISGGIESANFGNFTSTRGARLVQFNARLTF